MYEFGIGDAGELEYKFSYKNDSATAPYRVLRTAADNKTKLSLSKLTQTTLKFVLKVKYLLSLAVAVSMPLSSSPLKLLCSQSWNLQTVLEVN